MFTVLGIAKYPALDNLASNYALAFCVCASLTLTVTNKGFRRHSTLKFGRDGELLSLFPQMATN